MSDKSTKDSAASAASTANPPEPSTTTPSAVEAIEEDDEFEEFEPCKWGATDEDAEDGQQWQVRFFSDKDQCALMAWAVGGGGYFHGNGPPHPPTLRLDDIA